MKIKRTDTDTTTSISIEADVRRYQTLAFATAHRALFAYGWSESKVVAANDELMERLALSDEDIAKVVAENAAKVAKVGGDDEIIEVYVESWFAWHGVSVATKLIRKSLAEVN